MKNLTISLLAVAALFLASCTKGVEHTGDNTGTLYGNWVLDTKTVTYEGNKEQTVTDFTNDHFYLAFMEPQVAFGKEGSIFTFDIDDVDAVSFAYNTDKKQITFEKAIVLSTGFPPRMMELFGTYDVVELTSQKLVLSQPTESLLLGRYTTVYSYHKLVEHNNSK
jgi:hypothetical protein